ncbi:MAG: type ISP restriction/modification enzyme [Candidatus Binatia bacterium]
MSAPDPFRAYLQELRKNLSTGEATEHTYRPALKNLIEELESSLTATNEPKRVECGAPDFVVTLAQIPIGYVEAKDVGVNLDIAERSEQMDRYRGSLNNLILTNYLEFRWYVEGEHRETARLANLSRGGHIRKTKVGDRAVADLFQRFFAQEVPSIGRPKELAERMASLARMTRDLIEETFRQESEEGALHAQLKAFRETLIPFLTPAQFADMYAQTITYGLFAARVRVPVGTDFTREKAAWNLPKTNPFLRRFFSEIAGPDLDDRIAWLVDDLARLLARADMAEVLRDFGRRTRQEDPVVHFYETFLAAYDPEERIRRGVFYTPEPVVSYIVRSLHHLVEARFDRPLGLADTDTLILDPAVGTATFLYFVIQQIYETLAAMGQAGAWNNYVADHLLPRVFGFELLMAPYAVAHMKLGILLQETGYDFAGDQRLGIYLTNSLEQAITEAETLGFAGFITEEANAAGKIKREKPIMVVLGNPPYSVSSVNKGEHIEKLMERYKEAVRDEQNIQPLSDDYIKFIRFAHDRIERTSYGVIGMITNHTYLSGLIHRGMREELLKTFDEIYALNLHGNALMGETAPDGGPDENVFDIRQGVAISLFVKRQEGDSPIQVKYADLWGLGEDKYRYLLENDVSTTNWEALEPASPYFFFVPKELDLQNEYNRGWKASDIFQVSSLGVEFGSKRYLLSDRRTEIVDFVESVLLSSEVSDDVLAEQYGLRTTSGWRFRGLRTVEMRKGYDPNLVVECLESPFNIQFTYHSTILRRPQLEVLSNMRYPNKALLTLRQSRTSQYGHFFVTNTIYSKDAISIKDRVTGFPLYLYTTPEDTAGTLFETKAVTREPNLSPAFIAAVKEKLELDFMLDGEGDLERTFGPEDILHYAYAVFNSPTYQHRYAEFLRIDFPQLPLTSDLGLFKALAEKGEELVALHLMESPKVSDIISSFPVPNSNEVVSRHPRYLAPDEPEPGTGEPLEEGRVYINEDQYFAGIDPDVWQFQIGGYQVLHKWLKDRKGRKLSWDNIYHYQRIVIALNETMRLMAEIDELIPGWPVE